MVREVTKVEFYGANRDAEPRSYIIASSATIVKGTYLKFADPRTVSASTGTADVFAGFAGEGHSGTDYSTTISLWTNAIVEGKASGSITAGDALQTAAAGNYVMTIPIPADANFASAAILLALAATDGRKVGIAQESASAGEDVTFRINI